METHCSIFAWEMPWKIKDDYAWLFSLLWWGGNTISQNVSDAAKAVLREKLVVLNAYIKKKSEIFNN